MKINLQPKQYALLDAITATGPDVPTQLAFGGSRGAAKSGGVRRIAVILANEIPGVVIWIVRRVWDDLKKDHIDPLLEVEFPEFKEYWHAVAKELRFPNGSTIYFVHAGDSGRAKRKARGPQAHFIFLEQAEEFSQQEMEQLAGSNRAPGVAPGFCKRIYTFNPGGIGTMYLRRVFHLKEYRENETAGDFAFIQGFGWDNYEWFRGLETVSEHDFYNSPEWSDKKRFDVFTTQTDFGKKLNSLPPAQRIGELMGDFDNFSGQYYADVWEQKAIVLPGDLVGRIIQPWWRRWLATDWGFSHYAATGWFASGLLSPSQAEGHFGVACGAPVRVIILYRVAVCNDVPEPDLAKLIVSMTPDHERKEIHDHWMGHDAWAKRGSANTVVEQMEPTLQKGGLCRLDRADIDRVGGWRMLYNCLASARKLRKWSDAGRGPFVQSEEEPPALFISAECPEVISSIPMLICKDDDPKDIEKVPGEMSDDVADMLRYGVKSYLSAEPKAPRDVEVMETFQAYQDPTARAMAMLRLSAKQGDEQYIHRRRRA